MTSKIEFAAMSRDDMYKTLKAEFPVAARGHSRSTRSVLIDRFDTACFEAMREQTEALDAAEPLEQVAEAGWASDYADRDDPGPVLGNDENVVAVPVGSMSQGMPRANIVDVGEVPSRREVVVKALNRVPREQLGIFKALRQAPEGNRHQVRTKAMLRRRALKILPRGVTLDEAFAAIT